MRTLNEGNAANHEAQRLVRNVRYIHTVASRS